MTTEQIQAAITKHGITHSAMAKVLGISKGALGQKFTRYRGRHMPKKFVFAVQFALEHWPDPDAHAHKMLTDLGVIRPGERVW
jgi:hypothetical protein